MTDPKNPCDPRSKKISQAPPPITRLTGGSPPRLRPPQITPKGMEWIKDFIEENEDARQQLYDGDITAFERFRDGRLWLIEKDKWGGDDQFWDFARRTGHVRVTEGSTAPLFIKQGVEQPDTATGGVNSKVEGKAKGAFSKAKVRRWYTKRVKEWPPDQRPPSRDEDIREAKDKFGDAVTHEFIRGLRAELAPGAWKEQRRPKAQ